MLAFNMIRADGSAIANLKSPKDLRLELAQRAKVLRLDRNLRQSDLAQRSGVTLASLRRFESEGEISLKNLVLLAIALNRAQDIEKLFVLEPAIDLFAPEKKSRRRARQ